MTASKKNPYLGIVFGVLAAIVLSTALVALTALLLQKQAIGFESVPYINPIIKSVCALAAALLGTGRFEKLRFVFGALAGLGYIVITTVVFGLLSGGVELTSANLIDACMCAFAGMIGGIIRSLSR